MVRRNREIPAERLIRIYPGPANAVDGLPYPCRATHAALPILRPAPSWPNTDYYTEPLVNVTALD